MLTRLFDETSERPHDRLHFPVRMVLVNAAAAVACVVCALAYFAEAFAAGEFPGPVPFYVEVFLWSMVIAVATLGILLGARARFFPWLAALLTPLFSGLIMTIPGDRDGFSTGLSLGGVTSAVFLLGACAARGDKRWVLFEGPSVIRAARSTPGSRKWDISETNPLRLFPTCFLIVPSYEVW